MGVSTGVSTGISIVIYRVSIVYLSCIYRISNVVDSGKTENGEVKTEGTA